MLVRLPAMAVTQCCIITMKAHESQDILYLLPTYQVSGFVSLSAKAVVRLLCFDYLNVATLLGGIDEMASRLGSNAKTL